MTELTKRVAELEEILRSQQEQKKQDKSLSSPTKTSKKTIQTTKETSNETISKEIEKDSVFFFLGSISLSDLTFFC